MGRVRAATLVLAVLAAGLVPAGCGGGGNGELLPGTTADKITANLDQVRESVAQRNCEKAEDAVAQVSTEVDGLQQVNAELKKALKHGAAKLSEVVSGCRAEEEAEEAAAAEEAAEEEQEQLEAEEEAEEEAFEKEQKEEEREEKEKTPQEKAEERAEQPGPPEEGEESGPPGKAKGHEKQEEIETPTEEEVIPPTPGEGPAGGIGPNAAVEEGEASD